MMSNYARIDQNNVVFETFRETDKIKITDVFPPNIITLFIIVPDNVEVFWRNIDGAWTPPEVPSNPE